MIPCVRKAGNRGDVFVNLRGWQVGPAGLRFVRGEAGKVFASREDGTTSWATTGRATRRRAAPWVQHPERGWRLP